LVELAYSISKLWGFLITHFSIPIPEAVFSFTALVTFAFGLFTSEAKAMTMPLKVTPKSSH